MVQSAKVLYVDDEESNLVVFKTSLKKHLEVVTATSGSQALEILEKEEVPVLISDQRMPGMTGSELLERVRARWPDTVRMIVTAYSSFDAVVAAINRGEVARFLSKPWDTKDLLSTILAANRLYFETKENKALTEQLLHRERLAAIGDVTQGLVRELEAIGQVFTSAKGLSEFAGEAQRLAVERLADGHRRFVGLVQSLRSYSKPTATASQTAGECDLTKLVARVGELLRLVPRSQELAELQLPRPDGPLACAADPRRIEQVLWQLLRNAVDEAPATDGRVRLSLSKEGDRVAIAIIDNRAALNESTETNMTITMCRRIVESFGGSLWAELVPGKGYETRIELPTHSNQRSTP